MDMRRQPIGWKEVALICGAILCCLLVGEAATRLLDPNAAHRPLTFNFAMASRTYNPVSSPIIRYDPVLGHEPVGGASGTLMGHPVSYTADGLRNHGLGGPAPKGSPILAVGDSFTEGWAVDDDVTWPAYLQHDLGRPVLNAGVRGYGVDQMILRAERLAPRFKPGVIVLAFIADDIDRTGLAIRQGIHKPYFLPAGDSVELHNVPVPTTPYYRRLDPLRRIVGYSSFLDFIMRRIGAYEFWQGDSIKIGAAGDLVSCRLMPRFASLVRKEAAAGLVVAFPSDMTGLDERTVAELRQRASALLACAREAGLTSLDTHDGFAAAGAVRDPEAFYFDRHFTARGNALAAKLIAATLQQLER
jgi:hypothetical protein